MTATNHILIIPISSRSHLRLLLQFTLNLLTIHPSTIATILIPSVTASRIEQETALQPKRLMDQMGSRIRVTGVEVDLLDLQAGSSAFAENQALRPVIGSYFEDILSGKGKGRFSTTPCMVICDVRVNQTGRTGLT